MSEPAPAAARSELCRGLSFALAVAVASRVAVYVVGYVAHHLWGDGGSLVQPFCHWDCGWYASIVRDGYAVSVPEGSDWAVNPAFFPLHPLLARLLGYLIPVGPEVAVLIAGNLAFLLAAPAIYAYGRDQLGDGFGRTLVLVTSFSPYSIYFSAGYTEALFLLLTALALLLWARERFLLAGLAAAGASASRSVGVLLVLPFAIAALRDGALLRAWRPRPRDLRLAAGILLVPAGLALFMAFLYVRTGDALAMVHAQQLGWQRTFANPIEIFWDTARSSDGVEQYLAGLIVLGFGLAAYLAIRGRHGESAFLLAGILVPLSTSSWSMPRYIFGLLPTYVALALLVRDLRLPLAPVVAALALLDGHAVVAWVMGFAFLQ
jgi:hypothetical protein